jgi:hypothetical protein
MWNDPAKADGSVSVVTAEVPDRTGGRLLSMALRLVFLAGCAVVAYLLLSAGAARADDRPGIQVAEKVADAAAPAVGDAAAVGDRDARPAREGVRDEGERGSDEARAPGGRKDSARTVEKAAEPVSRTVETSAKPSARSIRPVTRSVGQAADEVTRPVGRSVEAVTEPVRRTLRPVTAPVVQTVRTVTAPALGPTVRTLAPVLAAPVLRPVTEVGGVPGTVAAPARPRASAGAIAPAATPAVAPPPGVVRTGAAPPLRARSAPPPAHGSPSPPSAAASTRATGPGAPRPVSAPLPAYLGLVSSSASSGADTAPRAWATTSAACVPAPAAAGTAGTGSVHRHGRRPSSAAPPG